MVFVSHIFSTLRLQHENLLEYFYVFNVDVGEFAAFHKSLSH